MKIKSIHELGHIIRDRRRALGWDQQRLADEAGVSRQWILQLEAGKARAAVELVLRTLRALRLSLDINPSEIRETAEPADLTSVPDIDLDRIIENARGRR